MRGTCASSSREQLAKAQRAVEQAARLWCVAEHMCAGAGSMMLFHATQELKHECAGDLFEDKKRTVSPRDT